MATYYVDITTGDDADTGLTEALAWKTFAKTQSAPIAAGDKVYVKGSATYTTRLVISVVGTTTAPIVFEGYTTTPGDEGMVTVTDTTNNTGLTPAAGSNYYVIKNFRFTGMSGVGAGNLTSDSLTYKKCRFDTNGGNGVNGDLDCRFEGCYAHNNSGDGFNVGGPGVFVCCISNSNTVVGFQSEGENIFYRCEAFGNGTKGFSATTAGSSAFFDCVCDGNGKVTDSGFDLNVAGAIVPIVVNCVAYDCMVGMTGNVSSTNERSISRNNLVNSNTTAYTNFQTWAGESTAAPGFVSEAAQDYTPAVGSPLIAAGFGVDTHDWITRTGPAPCIGSGPQVAAAGGGGVAPFNIRTGGQM